MRIKIIRSNNDSLLVQGQSFTMDDYYERVSVLVSWSLSHLKLILSWLDAGLKNFTRLYISGFVKNLQMLQLLYIAIPS